MADARIKKLRALLKAAGDPEDAKAQQAYLKTPLRFAGVKTAVRRGFVLEAFGRKSTRAEVEDAIRELWRTDTYDERATALSLLKRVLIELDIGDLPWLHAITRDCDNWALLDTLACDILGPLALLQGEALFKPVRRWSTDVWMWTRRASILVHLIPGRKQKLAHKYAWATFEERLPEKEFFIRKAIGWTLRECGKHYAQNVHDFLVHVGDRASGLTRREGARNLPDKLRIPILGK